MTNRGGTARARAAADLYPPTLGLFRTFRNDVDDAIDRVGSPQSASWPADYFDSVDVFQNYILYFPEHSGEHGRIYAAPVYEDLQFVGEQAGETPGRYLPLVGVDPPHLHARYPAQGFRKAAHSQVMQVFCGEHGDRRGGGREFFGFSRGQSDLDLHEFFQAQQGQIRGGVRSQNGLGYQDEK